MFRTLDLDLFIYFHRVVGPQSFEDICELNYLEFDGECACCIVDLCTVSLSLRTGLMEVKYVDV